MTTGYGSPQPRPAASPMASACTRLTGITGAGTGGTPGVELVWRSIHIASAINANMIAANWLGLAILNRCPCQATACPLLVGEPYGSGVGFAGPGTTGTV